MKAFTIAAIALGVIWVQGAPLAQAQECEGRVAELERQVRELQEQIAGLAGGSGDGEIRRTTTGRVFTKVARRGFGESWRDPSGMIWGDIAKNADGSSRYMNQYEATEYCQSLSAQLPSLEDFVRLREYMGGRSEYTPQVLPNLTRDVDGQTHSNWFWSSSVHPVFSNNAYVFDGRDGYFGLYTRDLFYDAAVRCMARR